MGGKVSRVVQEEAGVLTQAQAPMDTDRWAFCSKSGLAWAFIRDVRLIDRPQAGTTSTGC